MKKHLIKHRLVLETSTLRVLADGRLAQAAGGHITAVQARCVNDTRQCTRPPDDGR
jgi:hypothetical protein